ncbi:MAG TPA: glycoside hydrolase family 97 N-terminal domain-containing protein [Desulfuromonadaceae bacterium]|nr:glycoside hydrolase family 97 N-terminal domain-containing protein [Desulfuromonadaceae bacterium]
MKKILPLFLLALLFAGFFAYRHFAPARAIITSPNRSVRLALSVEQGQLSYTVTFSNQPVIELSPMNLIVDGSNLCQNVRLGRRESYQHQERYPTRGLHASAIDDCNGATITVKQGSIQYTLEARAFNDGIAFRMIVPGASDASRVPGEQTTFTLPEGATVWYSDLSRHYEGTYQQKNVAEIKQDEWAAPPVTFQLSNGVYASVTEGDLKDYPGMALQADGNDGFITRLGNEEPVNSPFLHDYSAAYAKELAKPASVTGTITTPWRVVMVGADLNTLVNCDILTSLSPPPDKGFFPDGADWTKPGRAAWCWIDGGQRTPEGMKEFSRIAGDLGFEYVVVDAFWYDWTDAQIRDLVEYAKARGVGIWLWRHGRDVKNPSERRAFFKRCHDLGVVGVKLDAFSDEAKEFVDLYQACFRDAAESRLMLDVHGANKPTGESRTWPNELTREGIFGLEHHKSTNGWAQHNTTLPFTRFLAGPGDYTPMIFSSYRNNTSWAHQIATAVVYTSPLLCYAANPQTIVTNPAVDIIKSIPPVWDETIVLPPSEIGALAIYARRNGDTWFLAVLNGPQARSLQIPLKFLGNGSYDGSIVKDALDNPAAVKIENRSYKNEDALSVDLPAGGGLVARFIRGKKITSGTEN